MSVNIEDPNYFTFKPNALTPCFGSMTFKSNNKEEYNPFSVNPSETKDFSINKHISTQNNDDTTKAKATAKSTPLLLSSPQPNQLTHDSFLKVTLHLLFNISSYKKFFYSKAFNSDDPKSKLLAEIKAIFKQYEARKEFFVDHLHYLLSKLFKDKSKFSMIYPDNPIDCYFIMINCLHNYSIQSELSNITNQQCYSCFSHSNFYMDILRKEQCDCGWNRTESLSSLNYIMNIRIDWIFNLAQNSNLIEMNKTYKFKPINFCSKDKERNALGNNENRDVSYELMSGKLFFYLSNLLNDDSMTMKQQCNKCNKNYITKSLLLNNLPTCLSFSLSNANMFSFDLKQILLCYILIPKIFELGQLFDNSSNNKIFYDFCGIIMLKKTMTYSVAIKCPDTTWKYDCEDNSIYYQSWFDLITKCLKDMCMPILLLYQIQDKYSNNEKDLNCEDIRALERYVNSIDVFRFDNSFRISEGIIQIDKNSQYKYQIRIEKKKSSETNSNTDKGGCINNNKNHSSKTSTCNSNSTTSKNSSVVNRDEMIRYSCLRCGLMNTIENVQCLSCMKSNIDVINKIRYSSRQDDSLTIHTNNEEEAFKHQYFGNRYNSNQVGNNQQHHQLVQSPNQIGIGQQYKQSNNRSKDQMSLNNTINRKQYSMKQSSPIPVMINQQQVTCDKSPSMISRDISQDTNTNKIKSKEHKPIKKPIAISEKWKCDICQSYNEANEYKCFSCKIMNTFQRDLLKGIKQHTIQKDQSPNLQYRNKPSIKINRSQLHYQTGGSSKHLKLNTRQLSLESITPDDDYDYSIKQKANSIRGQRVPSSASRMITSPTKRSQTGKMTKSQCASNPNADLLLTRPKTSLYKKKESSFS